MNHPLPTRLVPQDLLGIEGLFTDVDDTLTKDGKLGAKTYLALWQLREAGLPVIPVTGRSYGWAHMMLSQWPVDAVIAESGGVYLCREASPSRARGNALRAAPCPPTPLKVVYFDDIEQVASDRNRLMRLCEQILIDFPQLRFASDNVLRQVDVAVDYCEDVPRVPMEIVQTVIQILRDAGFQARHSTVHINAWHGSFDKGPMALRFLQEARNLSLEEAQERWAFIGDAPNDSTMFAFLPRSFAVANITPYLPTMQEARPARLTHASHGEGFVEFAELLLNTRHSLKT